MAPIESQLIPLILGCAIGVVIGGLLFGRRPRETRREETPEVVRRFHAVETPSDD